MQLEAIVTNMSGACSSRRSQVVAVALGAFATFAVLLGSAGEIGAQAGPHMSLNARGTGVSCDAPVDPSKCDVPAGGAFTLAVEVVAPPPDGYIAMQSEVYVNGFTWTPASVEDENVWPDNQLPVRSPAVPADGTTVIIHGGLTSLTPPFTPSHHEGAVVELDLVCPQQPQTGDVALIAYGPDSQLGASFSLPDETLIVNEPVGSAELDIDANGAPLRVPLAYVLVIRCGEASGAPPVTPGQSLPGYAPSQSGATPGATTGPGTTGTTPTDGTPGTGGPSAATATPSGGAGGEDDGGGAPWAIIGVVIGVVAVAAAGGGYLWYLRRSRST